MSRVQRLTKYFSLALRDNGLFCYSIIMRIGSELTGYDPAINRLITVNMGDHDEEIMLKMSYEHCGSKRTTTVFLSSSLVD